MIKRYLSLIIVLALSVACYDNLSEGSLKGGAYDPSKDQDADSDIDNADSKVHALYYGPGRDGYRTWPNGSNPDDNTIYYLEADVFIDENVSVSDERVIQVLTGDHVDSVNNNLYQAGILISKINVYRSKKPNNSYTYSNDFIFNNDGSDPLLLDASTNDPLDRSKGARFRMGVHNTDGGGGIAAAYPVTNALAFNSNSGRNLISHEIGHIFKLWHTNIASDGPCEYANSYNRTMLNTIFSNSWRFVDCEIAIMRQYSKNLNDARRPWIQTSPFTGADTYPIDIDSILHNLERSRRLRLTNNGGAFDEGGGSGGRGEKNYETCNNK